MTTYVRQYKTEFEHPDGRLVTFHHDTNEELLLKCLDPDMEGYVVKNTTKELHVVNNGNDGLVVYDYQGNRC